MSVTLPNRPCSLDTVDMDLFISEVKKRPAIYNNKLKEHSDKLLKKQLWTEICEICLDNWNEMESSEKNKIGKKL